MDQQTGEVMSCSIEMEELVIQRMREPGQRMPISLLGRSERPTDRIPAEAGANVRILGDVTIVIVVDETMPVNRVIDRQRGHYEQKRKNKIPLLRRSKQASVALRFCGDRQ